MKKAKHNWFSNFLPFEVPIEYDGLMYETPEHFYQAMKVSKYDIINRSRIANAATPGYAKKLGQKVELRLDWKNIKGAVMEYALRYKFQKGTKYYDKLIATEDEIVEWNHWHDRIWGKCICDSCMGKGQNLLGRLLMKIRKDLING